MKKLLFFLIKCSIVLIIVVVFFCIYSKFLDKKIDELCIQNKQYVNHSSGISQKDKGNILIEKSSQNSEMLVMGSSELFSEVPENIKNMFPNSSYKSDISLVGHANVQNALHAINLGANSKYLKDKDVMIIESIQWFMNDEINIQGFLANFSELQFYEFLHNKEISEENKKYLCSRYVQLEDENIGNLKTKMDTKVTNTLVKQILNKVIPDYVLYGNITNKNTYILAKLYSSDKFIDKVLYQILRLYYWLRYQILVLKDKYETYQFLKSNEKSADKENINLDWNKIYSNAEVEGKEACTNNNLNVYDEYYTTYLSSNWEELKDFYKDTELLTSNEWSDFKFFLSVCKDLKIKPYVVLMSTNGMYYDYTGLEKEKRDEYYNEMENKAREFNYDVLNLKEFEYTPYFYCDVMHLGWKGWPYVVEKTIEHFSE